MDPRVTEAVRRQAAEAERAYREWENGLHTIEEAIREKSVSQSKFRSDVMKPKSLEQCS